MRFLFLILFSLILTQDRSAVVTGFCYLEDETDHSGVEIIFEPLSETAQSSTVYTDDDGFFTAALVEGIYRILYFKDSYIEYSIQTIEIFVDTILPDITLEYGNSKTIFGGFLPSGTSYWYADTTYRVSGDLSLNSGDVLQIEAGTKIEFLGEYVFTAYGKLFAFGTQQDSIYFTSGMTSKNPGDWMGINFQGSSSQGSLLQYTVIEYAGAGPYDPGNIKIRNNTNFTLNDCTIRYSSSNGLWGENGNGTAILNNCKVYSNQGSGIYLNYNSNLYLNNSEIFNNNGTGVNVRSSSFSEINNSKIYYNMNSGIVGHYDNSTVNVIGNQVYNNLGDGIVISNSQYVRNNTVVGNTQIGIRVDGSANEFRNNVIYNNGYEGLTIDGNVNTTSFGNNCINNIGSLDNNDIPSYGLLVTVNANGDSVDTWVNLFINPMLTNIENVDFTPLEGSPLIDAGHPDYLDPDGSISDIGAIYFDQGTTPPTINNISVDNTIGTFPLPVQFSSDFSGPVNSFEWDFGDGSSSSGANPVHLYTSAGSYSVSLTVEGPGGTDTYTIENMITVNEPQTPPIANFTADVNLGLIPLEVQFSNQSQNQIDSYLWDFGDGNTSVDEAPSHTYTIAGDYTVTLTVEGPYGSDTIVQENLITALEPEAVIAGFNLSAFEGVAPIDIEFSNESIGTIDSYLWDFGDGNTSTESNPVHTYTENGEYTITLTAEGPLNSDVTTSDITILSPAPIITSVIDVPDDQGGRVYINFVRSGWDTNEPNRFESYQVERLDDIGWVGLSTYNAYGQEMYTIEATTINDSTAGSIAENSFRVVATMDEGIWISNTGTGYSVDNIVPEPPTMLSGENNNGQTQLSWLESSANDLDYYKVYRGSEMIGMTGNTSFIESGLPYLSSFNYSVKSVDTNGNESVQSETVSVSHTTEISMALNEGANLISFYALPEDKSVGNVLLDIQNSTTAIIGEGVAATQISPGVWVGSLSTIEPGSGYWIILDQSDNLDFIGIYVGYDLQYDLYEGANLISFPHPISTSIGDALPVNIQDNFIDIIGQGVAASQISANYWVGSLSNFEGGKGYWVNLSQPVSFSFTEPNNVIRLSPQLPNKSK